MLQSQPVYPNQSNIVSTFPQTQSVLVPSNSIQQGQNRTYDSVQTNSNQNARPFANSLTNGPIVVNQAFSNNYQSLNSLNGNVNIGGMSVNQSSLRQTRESKYKNKYSFKRNVTVNSVGPLTSTFNNFESNANLRISQEILNESNYYKTIVSKQDYSLTQIRDISLNLWRKFDQNRFQTTDSVRQINQIIKIYNLTLVNLNPPVKPLEFISQEAVNNRSNVVQNHQIIYKEAVPALLPAFSQQYIIPAQPINHQIINSNQTPIIPPNTVFVPAQNIPQPIPQSIKIEQRPVNPNFEPRPTVIPQPQNCLPPSRPQQTKYETFETLFNESKIPQHTQSFKYQKYKPYVNKDIDIEPKNNYQTGYKPYVRDATNLQNYYGGNSLNLFDGKDEGTFVYESVQVRQLKRKIQQLEQQKTVLIDKIRVYEKSNNFENLNNQQNIQNCQQEISKLKAQIAQLTVIYNNNTATKPNQVEVIQLKKTIKILEENIKQYQQQLIQAQNHIIYLQNSRGSEDVKNFEAEIKYLRETIAKYTEHIEQIDIQKRQFEQLLKQKQTENHALAQEVHEANEYIQSLQQHIQNNPGQGNGISYEIYQNLIIEYGKKELQVIILLEEINRLNFSNKEFQGHLEKAEEYIITLQEAPNRDDRRLQALQIEHHNILNTIGQYEQKLLALSQENKSLKNRVTQVSSQKIEKLGSAVNKTSLNHPEYETLSEEIRKKEAESIHLKEQIHKLNEKFNETRDHLQKAEEYIIHLQETYSSKSPVTALQRPDSERTKLYEQQTKEWQARISQLENLLTRQIQEKDSLSKRAVEFKAEYDDMEYRYKNALQQLGKRYDELLDERNSIAVKLSDAQSKTNTGNSISHAEVQNLRQSLKTITAQLQESQNHLLTAESYIEHNSRNWEQASSFKEKHNQLQSFVTIISNDLESTRKQNQILAARIQSLENLVAQADKLKAENEQLTIVIREKDNVSVSTSLKQIDEVQEALKNYTRLYNQSQERIKQLELQQQKNLSQIAQLEQYLTKAESFIIEQQNAEKIKEKSVNELTQQLIKAEEHIFTLENEYNSALKLKDEYETISRAEYQKNTELHDALMKAQAHIFELQSKYLKK